MKKYKMIAWGKMNNSEDRNRDTADHVFTVCARRGFKSARADAFDLDFAGCAVPGGVIFPGHGVLIQYESGCTRTVYAYH